MNRAAFLAMLPGLPLIGKLFEGKRWTPLRMPSETDESWCGPLHFKLQSLVSIHDRNAMDYAKFFHCNLATMDALAEEVFVVVRPGGWVRGGGMQKTTVDGLEWVEQPQSDDGWISVFAYRCLLCQDTGMRGNWKPAGYRTDGAIPEYKPYREVPCPDCSPIRVHMTDAEIEARGLTRIVGNTYKSLRARHAEELAKRSAVSRLFPK